MVSVPSFQAARPRGLHRTRPWSSFAHVSRELQLAIERGVGAAGLPPDARVLDYGCASSPYRPVFGADADYVAADLPGNPAADVELRADGSVPLPSGSVDLVLSTQVLEHVEDPVRYLQEARRLLKPGGTLLLTTHGIMYYHRDPEDYWRWTSAGLVRVVESAGLSVEDVSGVVGLVPACLQLLQDSTCKHLPRPLRYPYVTLMQALMAATDRRHSDGARKDNSLVLAVRAVRRP